MPCHWLFCCSRSCRQLLLVIRWQLQHIQSVNSVSVTVNVLCSFSSCAICLHSRIECWFGSIVNWIDLGS
ncbi:hypothetical protein BDDG_12012 [Blastomyces dermatitidis ATCC 18188]|uniref:Uncharacterized protein n=1 Tax=Ajellomyces dermatitidis (strain ATCC 18188 / CBS 674.68) TaxID=653446 RepID=A0A0J9EMG0_AJEDA|nr:hypothetical protein BDDG_12012 [Blastomyces dermatitidis ATCC 18188]